MLTENQLFSVEEAKAKAHGILNNCEGFCVIGLGQPEGALLAYSYPTILSMAQATYTLSTMLQELSISLLNEVKKNAS